MQALHNKCKQSNLLQGLLLSTTFKVGTVNTVDARVTSTLSLAHDSPDAPEMDLTHSCWYPGGCCCCCTFQLTATTNNQPLENRANLDQRTRTNAVAIVGVTLHEDGLGIQRYETVYVGGGHRDSSHHHVAATLTHEVWAEHPLAVEVPMDVRWGGRNDCDNDISQLIQQ